MKFLAYLLTLSGILVSTQLTAQEDNFEKAMKYWSQAKIISTPGELPPRGWYILPNDHIRSTPIDSAKKHRVARVLFIGNSYTFYNNMPMLVDQLATSQSDTLIYYAHAVPGNTFRQHFENGLVHTMLQKNWDYLVLQGNSRETGAPWDKFITESYPYAKKIDSLFHHFNPKGKTVLYMTWGHKNGDEINCITNTEVCTFDKMTARVRERYLLMRDSLNSWVAPVGSAWRNLRQSNPKINLYVEDNFHPTYAGSYLIASTIYSTIFGQPLNSDFRGELPSAVAKTLQYEAGFTVLDSLSRWKIVSPYHTPTLRTIAPVHIEIKSSGKYKLWLQPNPARTTLYWSISPMPAGALRIQVLNAQGTIVVDKSQSVIPGMPLTLGTKFNISIGRLPKGNYFFVVLFGRQRVSTPFVKN